MSRESVDAETIAFRFAARELAGTLDFRRHLHESQTASAKCRVRRQWVSLKTNVRQTSGSSDQVDSRPSGRGANAIFNLTLIRFPSVWRASFDKLKLVGHQTDPLPVLPVILTRRLTCFERQLIIAASEIFLRLESIDALATSSSDHA